MQATCEQCRDRFEAKRSTAKYCTTRCRTRATRARATRARAQGLPAPAAVDRPAAGAAVPPASAPPPAADGGDVPLLIAATISELVAAGRLGTTIGQQAVKLAERMVNRSETGSAVASLSKELRATMVEALKGTAQEADPIDELRARRDRKRAG